jgi:hypothetical protein
MYRGWTQKNTKTSTKYRPKGRKKYRTTEEEMEGPTSSWGLRNRITHLNLHEHCDDYDDDDYYYYDILLYSALKLILL